MGQKSEVFSVLYLDTQNKVIGFEELFQGTIDGAAVYPREVAMKVLECNASAIILAHNHPSGEVNPSRADKRITGRLKDALSLIDVRILDHVIVSPTGHYSMAQHGDL